MGRLLLFLLMPFAVFAQPSQDKAREERQSKSDMILRIQDLRTPHDGKLVSFLSDTDPVIRERAVRAFGSIQDTSVVPQLAQLLLDSDSQVELSAAFAYGQTASLMSKGARQALEHDAIWNRLDVMQPLAAELLIEEIGRFGTDQGLADLLLRFSETYPQVHTQSLVMCIARYAVRNVTTPDAIHYLLRFVHPIESTSWRVMYALQRIGDREEIRYELDHIARHYNHHDPLVRMYLASLLGKVRDERPSLVPLQKLADYDPDWRVRVNALKALSNFDLHGKDDVIATYKRAFYSENMYIALAALSAFGNTGLTERDSGNAVAEAFSALRRIAENKDNAYLWQMQAEAASSLAALEGKEALAVIKLKSFSEPLLQARILQALASTGAPEASETLLEYVGNNSLTLYRAALEGLQTLSNRNPQDTLVVRKTYRAAVAGLSNNDVAIVTTAASILGDSLFRQTASVGPLIETLSHLRLPYDIEAMQEVASTLGKLGDKRSVDALSNLLKQPDRSVAVAAVAALKSITGRDYSRDMKDWYQPLVTDLDLGYLHSLPDVVHVSVLTIRGEIMLELYKNVAPFTVMSFVKLATQRGFYRGLVFHRVVPNFVIQGGDPRGDGWGGPEYTLRSEFTSLSFDEGMVGMADAGKDTPGSQFFITQSPQPHLDGRYTLFGKVISGMDVVDSIQVGDHIFDVKVVR